MKTQVFNFWQAHQMRIMVAVLLMVIFAAGYIVQYAFAQQPHMHAALDALRTAETQLEKATPDKGGHRKKALELVRKAIKEVEKGIAYDRRN